MHIQYQFAQNGKISFVLEVTVLYILIDFAGPIVQSVPYHLEKWMYFPRFDMFDTFLVWAAIHLVGR